MVKDLSKTGYDTLAIESEDKQVESANMQDVTLKVIKDKETNSWWLKADCKDKNKGCVSVHTQNQIECSVRRSGPKVCDDKLTSQPTRSEAGLIVFDLCPAQLDNIKLAIGILSKSGSDSSSALNYQTKGIKSYDALAIRSEPKSQASIVGAIPEEGSGVSASCEPSAASPGWCKDARAVLAKVKS